MTEPRWEVPPPEVPRDGRGRPMIIPLEGGKTVAYTRCTTFIGCLEDTTHLSKWRQRKVAEGLVVDPDLYRSVIAKGRQPEDAAAKRTWNGAMDAICKAAAHAAGADDAAELGTNLHGLTERLDRGQPLGKFPDRFRPHIEAYQAATKEFTARHIERFTVHDGLKIGGTPDRVLEIDGVLHIGDLKTGSLDYGTKKMAMQLAVYSRSLLYDPLTGQRTTPGDIDQDRGLIIALDAKTGQCDLIWIDLAAGWQDVQLAQQVRQWQSRKETGEKWATFAAGMERDLVTEAQANLNLAIKSSASPENLTQLWRTYKDSVWLPSHTELAVARKAALRHLHSV